MLVSVMHANNEVGTIQPIEEIAVDRAGARDPRPHGCGAVGGQNSDQCRQLGVDLLTSPGTSCMRPKGVGALYVRRGVELEPLIHGAGHEGGRRAGTENVLLAVGLGAACALAAGSRTDGPHPGSARSPLERATDRFGDRVVLNGHPEHRLPNTLNVTFIGMVGADVLARP